MATERSRARRGNPYPRSEPAWRKGCTENTASARFSREQLLLLFRVSASPLFLEDTESFSDVVLEDSVLPVFAGNIPFSHSLGEELNSRERQVKMPDWYPVAEGETVDLTTREQPTVSEPVAEIPPKTVSPKPVLKQQEPPKPLKIVLDPKAVVRNLPKDLEVLSLKAPAAPAPEDDVFEERYSSIDVEMEKKLKEQEEDDEEIPEWAQSVPEKPSYTPAAPRKPEPAFEPRTRKFSIQLLQSQIGKGDPFAKMILDNGTDDGQGYAHLSPYSLPLEKVWFYKDPQMQVQGPFTSIEMYSWNLMGYFSKNLLVAWKTPIDFRPLGLMTVETGRRLEETPVVAGLFEKFANEVTTQKPVNAKTVNEIEKTSSTKWGNSYNEHFPAFSSPAAPDPDPSAALKSMLGIKPDQKVTAWGVPQAKAQTKSLVEIQREQKEAMSRKR